MEILLFVLIIRQYFYVSPGDSSLWWTLPFQEWHQGILKEYQVCRRLNARERIWNQTWNCCHWRCTGYRTTRFWHLAMCLKTAVWLKTIFPPVLWTRATRTSPSWECLWMIWKRERAEYGCQISTMTTSGDTYVHSWSTLVFRKRMSGIHCIFLKKSSSVQVCFPVVSMCMCLFKQPRWLHSNYFGRKEVYLNWRQAFYSSIHNTSFPSIDSFLSNIIISYKMPEIQYLFRLRPVLQIKGRNPSMTVSV